MQELPRAARIYIVVMSALGFTAALGASLALFADPSLVLPTIFLTGVITILDLHPVQFRAQHFESTISAVVKVPAVILLAPPAVVLATFCGNLLREWRMPRAWYKKIFKASALTACYVVAAFAYHALHQRESVLLTSIPDLMAIGSLAISAIVVNGVIVSLVVALTISDAGRKRHMLQL